VPSWATGIHLPLPAAAALCIMPPLTALFNLSVMMVFPAGRPFPVEGTEK